MKKIFVATVIASAFVAASAFAAPLNGFTGSSVNVNVAVNNGIATLTGHVESNLDRSMAAQVAAKLEGVEDVRNLITLER